MAESSEAAQLKTDAQRAIRVIKESNILAPESFTILLEDISAYWSSKQNIDKSILDQIRDITQFINGQTPAKQQQLQGLTALIKNSVRVKLGKNPDIINSYSVQIGEIIKNISLIEPKFKEDIVREFPVLVPIFATPAAAKAGSLTREHEQPVPKPATQAATSPSMPRTARAASSGEQPQTPPAQASSNELAGQLNAAARGFPTPNLPSNPPKAVRFSADIKSENRATDEALKPGIVTKAKALGGVKDVAELKQIFETRILSDQHPQVVKLEKAGDKLNVRSNASNKIIAEFEVGKTTHEHASNITCTVHDEAFGTSASTSPNSINNELLTILQTIAATGEQPLKVENGSLQQVEEICRTANAAIPPIKINVVNADEHIKEAVKKLEGELGASFFPAKEAATRFRG